MAKRSKKTLREQVQENFPEFEGEVSGLDASALNNRLATLAKHLEQSETAKEEDEDLASAKEHASELAAPYRDARNALRTKSKFIIQLLKEKGIDS